MWYAYVRRSAAVHLISQNKLNAPTRLVSVRTFSSSFPEKRVPDEGEGNIIIGREGRLFLPSFLLTHAHYRNGAERQSLTSQEDFRGNFSFSPSLPSCMHVASWGSLRLK